MQSGRWKAIRGAVCSLADSLAKYCSYLAEKSCEVQQNHSSLFQVQSGAKKFCVIKQAKWVKPTYAAQYRNIQIHIDATKDIEPILVNDLARGETRYVVPSISMYSADIYFKNVFVFKEKAYLH